MTDTDMTDVEAAEFAAAELAAFRTFVAGQRELAPRYERQARTLAGEWSAWADELQALMDRLPGLPRHLLVIQEDDEPGVFTIALDHVRDGDLLHELGKVRAHADAAAAVYRRAVDKIAARQAAVLDALDPQGGHDRG